MEMTQINLKIDKKTKEQAQMIYKNLGMNLSTALTVFLRQSIADKGLWVELTALKVFKPGAKLKTVICFMPAQWRS